MIVQWTVIDRHPVGHWHCLELYLSGWRQEAAVALSPSNKFHDDFCYQTLFSKSKTGFMFINLYKVTPNEGRTVDLPV